MTRLDLSFERGAQIELVETMFSVDRGEPPRYAVRGKTSGAFNHNHTFQWSPAVRALALLCVRSVLRSRAGLPDAPALSGGQGSAAASLDYAISKQPSWMEDMFGVDRHGDAYLRRLVRRTNPERKRSGPVLLSLNRFALPPELLHIWVGGKEALDLRALAECEAALASICGEKTEESECMRSTGPRPSRVAFL